MKHSVAFFGSVAAALALAASPFLTHVAIARQGWGPVAYLLIALQAVLATALLRRRVSERYKPLVAAVLIVWIVVLCLSHLTTSLALLSAVPHATVYTGLLVLFALSLMPGHTPLVTRLALKIHGPQTDRIQRYTRGVTVAWCVFCSAQLVCSAVLLEFFAIKDWSFFVNILNVPLLVAMFVGERLIRLVFVSEAPHERPADLIGMVDLIKGDIARHFAKAR